MSRKGRGPNNYDGVFTFNKYFFVADRGEDENNEESEVKQFRRSKAIYVYETLK